MVWQIFPKLKDTEKETLELFKKHVELTLKAKQSFVELGTALIAGNFSLVEAKNKEIFEIERKADNVRRSIAKELYEGAFMPLMRTFLFDFAEALDDVVDCVQDAAEKILYFKNRKLPSKVKAKYNDMFAEVDKVIDLLNNIVNGLFKGNKNLKEKIKEAKLVEHNLDMIEKDVFDLVLLKQNKIEPVTTWLICDIAHLLAAIGDKVEESCDRVSVLSLIRLT